MSAYSKTALVTKKAYNLEYKKAFITGGSGFVGRTLIQTLLNNNVEIVAIARSENAEKQIKENTSSSVTVMRCDLSDMHK